MICLLQNIIDRLQARVVGSADLATPVIDIVSVVQQVRPGSVYVGIKGTAFDGTQVADQAFAQGAIACVLPHGSSTTNLSPGSKQCLLLVDNTRVAWSSLCALRYGDPAQELGVVGVTGTNGKTTTNWLVFEALRVINGGVCKPARFGTIGSYAPGCFDDPDTLTSADADYLHRMLATHRTAGGTHVVLETSSHALHQHRVDHLEFDVGVFTNLTQDHLDYHKTMAAYEEAKWLLFDLLQKSAKPQRTAVINGDDPAGARYVQRLAGSSVRTIVYGRELALPASVSRSAGIELLKILSQDHTATGSVVSLQYQDARYQISTKLVGAYNAENLAAAFGALIGAGFAPALVAEALTGQTAPRGRLELVPHPEVAVYVDYAHTPDALERVLKTVRPVTAGKLWVVVGCGGDRDATKRPIMGRIACAEADAVVVTSDNPRTEDPGKIIEHILAGCGAGTVTIPDRAAAIAHAIGTAAAGDAVVIAGKGHEDYQIIGTTKYPFSDFDEARRALAQRVAP